MKSLTLESLSVAEVTALGKAIANAVRPGQVISLVGNLGAGKTTLVRAIATGLDVPERDVSSPTFMLIQEYAGRLPLFHFDTYRLKNLDEFYDLGAEEYFYGEGVCVVEWGDRVKELFPQDHLRIEIEIATAQTRTFHFTAQGTRSEALLDAIAKCGLR